MNQIYSLINPLHANILVSTIVYRYKDTSMLPYFVIRPNSVTEDNQEFTVFLVMSTRPNQILNTNPLLITIRSLEFHIQKMVGYSQ